jgi:hypothetical protein
MDFEIGGYNYRVEKLNAIAQFHLSRKIAPLIPALAPVIVKYFEVGKGDLLGAKILQVAELAEPFAVALAEMTDEAAEQILMMALSKVQVQTDASKNVWMPLWNPAAKMASVLELNDFGHLLPVAIKAILFNLGNFIDGLLTRRGEPNPVPSGAAFPERKTG